MTAWWQKGVIYQIYPRSFKDSTGNGIGDLQGVISRLQYLQWLGVDVIWFSPIFPSPQRDFGYDVADYLDIEPDYGTMEDFDQLVEEAHKRNLKVMLDLVPNHTSIDHTWFKESRSSRDNPKRDWYIWKDPAPDGDPPNNWLAYFGGPAWTFDEYTGQYYMHNFDPGQPELNWRNPEVEAAMLDVIRFWLKRGADGWRVDVVDRIIKDGQFRDNPPNPDWNEGDPIQGKYLRVYSERRPEVHAYIKKMRGVFDEFDERLFVGEVAYDLTLEQLTSYYGDDSQPHGDEIHLPFNFKLSVLPWNAAMIRAHVDTYDGALPAYGWPNYVLGNHDCPRITSRVGIKQARVAMMLLLTLRGTPTIYNGDEIAMTNTPIPKDQIKDPQGRNTDLFNRDEARTPMQWDDTPHAGFTPNQDAETWLPVNPNYNEVNVAAQQDETMSMLNFTRELLHYRRENTALNAGAYESFDGMPDGTFVFLRTADNHKRLVALNLTDADQQIELPNYGDGKIALSTFMNRKGMLDLSSFTLKANEGIIFEV